MPPVVAPLSAGGTFSTGTSFTFFVQPATATRTKEVAMARRSALFMEVPFSLGFGLRNRSSLPVGISALPERRPRGLAHIAVRRHQPQAHAPVGGHCIEYATTPFLGRVEQHAAVRREARRFVQIARG